jgi:hypothetical protein
MSHAQMLLQKSATLAKPMKHYPHMNNMMVSKDLEPQSIRWSFIFPLFNGHSIGHSGENKRLIIERNPFKCRLNVQNWQKLLIIKLSIQMSMKCGISHVITDADPALSPGSAQATRPANEWPPQRWPALPGCCHRPSPWRWPQRQWVNTC